MWQFQVFFYYYYKMYLSYWQKWIRVICKIFIQSMLNSCFSQKCCVQAAESLHKTIVKRRMSHVSGGGSIDLSDTDSLQEWINMTGFLCALGGVCLQQRSSSGLATYSPPMGAVSERKGSMISVMSSEGNIDSPVSRFMDRLLSLMVCNHEKVGLQIRTNVKDLVGLELSPALYPMLFNKLKNTISKFFDSQGQVTSSPLCFLPFFMNIIIV